MIIDTHAHLDDPRFQEDLEATLRRAEEAGVGAVVIPGADPDTLERAKEIAGRYDNVYYAAGVHPYDAAKYNRKFLETFLQDPKCVAVGECGLDYYRLPDDADTRAREVALQKDVFADQIDLAVRYKKPLIVHIREASDDALEMLLSRAAGKIEGVLHCFNADTQLLRLADYGFYYGIGGVVTFKNAKKLPRVLPQIPLRRLVVETDAPYLTPHPHRGKRNEPAYTRLVVEKMAQLLDKTTEEIERLTTQNAAALFGLPTAGV